MGAHGYLSRLYQGQSRILCGDIRPDVQDPERETLMSQNVAIAHRALVAYHLPYDEAIHAVRMRRTVDMAWQHSNWQAALGCRRMSRKPTRIS